MDDRTGATMSDGRAYQKLVQPADANPCFSFVYLWNEVPNATKDDADGVSARKK
jgi:hypothetical protein